MATVKQIVYNVPGAETTQVNGKDIDLISNIFQDSSKRVTKVGIQAPPGTKFYIDTTDSSNDVNKIECIMGKTGMYELDEKDLTIYHLSFILQYQKNFNKEKTQAYGDAGKNIITAVGNNRDMRYKYSNWKDYQSTVELTVYDDIKVEYRDLDKDKLEKYGQTYTPSLEQANEIEDIYYEDYLTGYNLILKSENGLYDNGDAVVFQNIIIDYVEEDK